MAWSNIILENLSSPQQIVLNCNLLQVFVKQKLF